MIDYWIKREKEHSIMIKELKGLSSYSAESYKAIEKDIKYHVKEMVNCQGAIDRLGSK